MRVIPEDHPSKLPSKTLSGQASPEATSPKALRNAFGTCHASRRLSQKTPSKYALCPRSPAESHPESTFETNPSVFPSESATCPPNTPSRENPSGCRRAHHLSRVPKPRQYTLWVFSERDTCP